MAFIPTFKLYQDDGATLVYTFAQVINVIGWPKDNPSSVQLKNTRSGSAVTIPGGDKPFDLTIEGRLSAANYSALTTLMFALRDTVVKNTHYYLKLDKSNSTTDDIKTMRLTEITWDEKGGQRDKYIYYRITLSCNSW